MALEKYAKPTKFTFGLVQTELQLSDNETLLLKSELNYTNPLDHRMSFEEFFAIIDDFLNPSGTNPFDEYLVDHKSNDKWMYFAPHKWYKVKCWFVCRKCNELQLHSKYTKPRCKNCKRIPLLF